MRLFEYAFIFLLILATSLPVAADNPRVVSSDQEMVAVHPIQHASFVLDAGELRIAADPVGVAYQSAALSNIDLALVTDIHGDHFDASTLSALAGSGAQIIAPAAVAERMDEALRSATQVLANGDTTQVQGVKIKAIPMYNLTEGRLHYHPKGRGNGYVLEVNGLRIYIAGDTEDTPEMRALEDIDLAFIPMNLPYTMTVEQAADAVIEMDPRIVYPYHYRGQNGFSDLDRFTKLVHAAAPHIEVRRLDWYPQL